MHRHGSIRVVCETYGSQVLGISARRPLPVRGEGVLRLRAGQLGAVPALGRCGRRPRAGAVEAGRDRRAGAATYGATLFFAGPTFFANMLRADLPARRAGRRAARGVGGRGAARRAVPAVDRALRRRHHRRHRHDRDAAHLPVQPRRATCGRARPASPSPATTCGSSTTTGATVRAGTPGTLLVRGESAATGYWSRYDASRQVFQGEWLRTGDTYVQDADGYYALPRPHRRHAQGQRHVGLAGRGRGPAARPRRGRAGGRGRRARRRRAGEAGRLRRAARRGVRPPRTS